MGESQELLRDLKAWLSPDELSVFEARLSHARLGALSMSPTRGKRRSLANNFDEVQARLLETIPNVIAINWSPEGGQNQLLAAVEDIVRRLPSTDEPIRPSQRALSRRSSSLTSLSGGGADSSSEESDGSDEGEPSADVEANGDSADSALTVSPPPTNYVV